MSKQIEPAMMWLGRDGQPVLEVPDVDFPADDSEVWDWVDAALADRRPRSVAFYLLCHSESRMLSEGTKWWLWDIARKVDRGRLIELRRCARLLETYEGTAERKAIYPDWRIS